MTVQKCSYKTTDIVSRICVANVSFCSSPWFVYKGMDATWDDYLEVDAGSDSNVILDLYYKLPATWNPSTEITKMDVLMNSIGANVQDQKRTMKVRLGKKWLNIGDNSNNPDWTWTYQSMSVPSQTDMYAYFNNNNVVRLRLVSNNKYDVFEIDYLVVEVQFMCEDVTTPTGPNPTPAPVPAPTAPTHAPVPAPTGPAPTQPPVPVQTNPPVPAPTNPPVVAPTPTVTVGQFEVKTANDLPAANVVVAANNPLRGMMTSPSWVSYNQQNPNMPTSMDYYYIGLDTTMKGNNVFDWTTLEQKFNQSASQNRHAIICFILDYPEQANYVPQFLIDAGLKQTTYTDFGGGKSPDYTSPILLTALEQFITAFGANYDGDSRLAFIQIGLLGFWGEWHTYPHETWIPDSTKDSVSQWFDDAFDVTPLQVRYAHPSASTHKYGFHDDSFAHSTLSDTTGWFFWPEVQAMTPDYTNFWKEAVMGGELRPELQATAFSSTFPDPNNEFEQDFDLCVDTTHATYMLNNYAFSTGYSGSDLTRALASANRMGYQFRVSEVVASTNAAGTVDLDIQIMQAGVAPFYYKLGLKVTCDGNDWFVPSGVESIIEQGSTKSFTVSGLPKTASCLNNVAISLDCPHAYPGNPVKFAQGTTGTDNGKVALSFTVPP